jgi:hypothetical protein
MTVHQEYGQRFFECDECGDESDREEDFFDALKQIKSDGWLVTEDDGEWTHLCYKCVHKLPTVRTSLKD